MSKFTKILITLIFILIAEVLLIYIWYQKSNSTNSIKYDRKKTMIIEVNIPTNIFSIYPNGHVLKTYAVSDTPHGK